MDFEIVYQPRIQGPQRVQSWIRPLRPGFRAGFGIEYWTTDPVQVRVIRIAGLKEADKYARESGDYRTF